MRTQTISAAWSVLGNTLQEIAVTPTMYEIVCEPGGSRWMYLDLEKPYWEQWRLLGTDTIGDSWFWKKQDAIKSVGGTFTREVGWDVISFNRGAWEGSQGREVLDFTARRWGGIDRITYAGYATDPAKYCAVPDIHPDVPCQEEIRLPTYWRSLYAAAAATICLSMAAQAGPEWLSVLDAIKAEAAEDTAGRPLTRDWMYKAMGDDCYIMVK